MPHTLLWQTFLLIAGLLIFGLLVWSQIFRHFEESPRSRDLAQMVVSMVNLTRTALINAQPSLRPQLLLELAALEGIRIYPAEPGEDLKPLPNTRPMALMTAEVRRLLGEHTRFASRWQGLEGFWVSFRLDPEDTDGYWVMLPRERLQKPHALEWLSWGAASLVVALLGAFMLVSRISAPLRALAGAARAVGRGQIPPPLPQSGPLEIATVASAFNQMAGDLARIDADRALILAGVSHDLRTPLARLRLGVEMSGAPEGEVAAMVADIEEMDRIINQFLDFGRGEPQEPKTRLNLGDLAQELAAPHRLRGSHLSVTVAGTVVIEARPLPLRRTINNLIDNALRYAGSEKPIDIKVYAEEGHVFLSVSDRGPGIPPEQVEHMKLPFTRMESARSNTKGSGLGLAIVDRVMRAHDAQLSLLPREGGGLTALCRFKAFREPRKAKIIKN